MKGLSISNELESYLTKLTFKRVEMKKLLICAAFSLAIVASISTGYTSAKTDKSRVANVENNLQLSSNRWRLVKHTFRIHIPRNINALSQLIIDTPPTIAVSNDIDVLAQNGKKININVSTSGRRIVIDFSEKDISNTTLLVELNKVKQPTLGPDSVYNLSAKVVGSDAEISVGLARFRTF